MNRALTSASLLAVLLLACCCQLPKPHLEQAAQDQRMAWWRDARFGMFLHWGLYAIPAGEWGDGKDHGEWIRTTAQIPLRTYDALQPKWNPVDFDADEWARMAKDAGMKYVVITSKHHDGFCLFDSDVTDWDVGGTPHGRDIMQELSEACRRHGLAFCTYHSIMDWHHPDYLPRRSWETDRPTDGADFDRFERYLHAQVTEVITRYRPAVMWFDGEWEKTWTHERGVRLFDLCRRLAPEMIVNNRVDVHRQGMQGFSGSAEAVGDFDTPEQEIPATGLPGVDWESCMTMNRHWGWNAADTEWKPSRELVRNLIDIASKGGNYLLNVGPRADGTFPPQAVERLAEIGAWMQANGEAIYGTTASLFDALPFGRCTVKAGDDVSRLYLHVFDRPDDGRLQLPGLGNVVRRAFLLRSPDADLPVAGGGGEPTSITLPSDALDAFATVVVVEVAGRPVVYKRPTIRADSDTFVHALDVELGPAVDGVDLRYTLDGTPPTVRAPIARGPITIDASCTVTAAPFLDGRRLTAPSARTFAKVRPLPAVDARARRDGLLVRRVQVDWQRIGDAPRAFSGEALARPNATLPEAVGEHIALEYAGLLDVDRDDLYRFLLTSDDGSRLWIDDRLVVDNDGLHGPEQRSGEVALARGLHRLRLVWFNRTGGAELDLKWAPPGAEWTAVPDARLRH